MVGTCFAEFSVRDSFVSIWCLENFLPSSCKDCLVVFHQRREKPGLWQPPSRPPDNTILSSLKDGEGMSFKTLEGHGHSWQCWLWCPLPLHGVSPLSLSIMQTSLGGTCWMGPKQAIPYDRRPPGHECICYRLNFPSPPPWLTLHPLKATFVPE